MLDQREMFHLAVTSRLQVCLISISVSCIHALQEPTGSAQRAAEIDNHFRSHPSYGSFTDKETCDFAREGAMMLCVNST